MKNITLNFLKSLFLTATLFLFWGQTDAAAQNNDNRERIETMRIAYVTNKLALTTEEATSLWPLYNSYLEEMQKLRDQKDIPDLEREEKELAIKKKYNEKFKKAIPAKLDQFYQTLKEFNIKLLGIAAGGQRP